MSNSRGDFWWGSYADLDGDAIVLRHFDIAISEKDYSNFLEKFQDMYRGEDHTQLNDEFELFLVAGVTPPDPFADMDEEL